MAQTKTKSKSTPKRRSSSSRKPSSSRSRGNSSGSNSKSSPSKPAPAAAMSKAADKATNAVGSAAKKATVPLVAGGAAIVGAAGGMALGARQARRSNRHNLAKAARNVATGAAKPKAVSASKTTTRKTPTKGDTDAKDQKP